MWGGSGACIVLFTEAVAPFSARPLFPFRRKRKVVFSATLLDSRVLSPINLTLQRPIVPLDHCDSCCARAIVPLCPTKNGTIPGYPRFPAPCH